MMKRSIVFAGAVAVSLSSLILAAAEPAAETPAAPAPAAAAPAQIVAEETVTVVAATDGQNCPAAAKCADKKKCAPADKKCADKKCPPKAAECSAKECAPCPEYSDDDYMLAYELMELCNEPDNINNANMVLIEAQMQQIPMLQPARPAFRDFFHKHCSYDAMKRDLARIHLGVFTRDELAKIIDFFKTPEGRKLAANHTKLMHKCMELREKRINDNLPELQQNVHAAMETALQQTPGTEQTAAKTE